MDTFIRRRLRKSTAYKKMFLAGGGKLKEEAEMVLADLGSFCKIMADSEPEPLSLSLIEGRRQVLRRLWKFIKLNEHDLLKIMGERNDD